VHKVSRWLLVAMLFTTAMVGKNALAQNGIDPAKLPGIVVDNAAAELSGTWKQSTSVSPFVAGGYITANGPEIHTARFEIDVPAAGNYQVLVAYTFSSNRAPRVPVTIRAADGDHTIDLDQQKKPAGPYCFHPLGEFFFESGQALVTISTEKTQGAVIADAVQFLTADEFELAKKDAAKNPPPLATKPADKPATTAAAAKPAPVEPSAVKFEKAAPSRELARLTPAQLDALLEQNAAGISSSAVIYDEQFLRRVSLDIIGRQPSAEELDQFVADISPDKRAAVVERLLASPEYGANWANYWSDVISYRVPEPELTFLNYDTFKQWLAKNLNEDTTWDEVVFQILTADGKVGDNPAATYVGFHQANQSRLAAETSRIFLAVNIQCAECHDHPFVDMPSKTFHQMAAFFVRSEAKLPWNDSNGIEVKGKPAGEYKMPGGKGEMQPVAFTSKPVDLGSGDLTRRGELARWIVSPENSWFAKAYSNRIWARLMGRGFCEPVDDIGEGSEPVLPKVHAAVAEHFTASGFDAKELIRLIANTRAYQRGLNDNSPQDKPFAATITAKLRGDEVFASLSAAIELPNVTPPQATASSAVRFPPPPKSTRDLVNEAFGFDPSLTADYLTRTMAQAMLMMNNKQIQAQVDASSDSSTMLARLLADEKDNAAAATTLYQRVLARRPSERELEIATKYIAGMNDRGAAFEDLLWSLLNSAEFTTRR
jgi:hypothetical protein